MIRFIAALDEKRGMANDKNIPWLGKTPTDTKYYHDKLKTGIILMGYGTYAVISKPYHDRTNYVATDKIEPLRPGFEPVKDARSFLLDAWEDVWDIGGASLFASTFDLANELYITQLEGEYGCTKFFPEYENDFDKVSESQPVTENGITYRFTVWKRKI